MQVGAGKEGKGRTWWLRASDVAKKVKFHTYFVAAKSERNFEVRRDKLKVKRLIMAMTISSIEWQRIKFSMTWSTL